MMNTSQQGVDFIKRHEGCRLIAYRCQGNKWTIGYGHTGSEVVAGMQISQAQAEEYLKSDLLRFEAAVAKELQRTTFRQRHFDALVSFCYNIGTEAFRKSTLLRKVKADAEDATIRDEFMRWVNAGGKVSNGLVSRRKAEADYYFG